MTILSATITASQPSEDNQTVLLGSEQCVGGSR